MPRFRKIDEQARHRVAKKTQHGRGKRTRVVGEAAFISGIGTERTYRSKTTVFLRFLEEKRILVDALTPAIALQFLEQNAIKWRQKTLDGYRQAINVVFEMDLPYVGSLVPTVLKPRAYSAQQIGFLKTAASRRNKLSIGLCECGGLRAMELLTIGRLEDFSEDDRPWLPERFSGRKDGVIYVVHGKGGLKRKVMISRELAEELETMRLAQPITFKDREVLYQRFYDLIGGQSFSNQFTRLSNKVLGWSEGAHGLRHAFAKRRLRELQLCGFVFDAAVEVLSQEMGHFSTKNTLTYLR